jgi:GT2 family glycosyltransferase
MAAPVGTRARVSIDGKFFRLSSGKFFVKGVTYGPFVPNGAGEPFAQPDQTRRDFALLGELGVNLLRIYHVPPSWFLALASEFELRLLVDVPWTKQVCFLDKPYREEAKNAVRAAAQVCAKHPAVFALSVANELPPDIVRWSGATAVEDFIDELVGLVKEVDPECLCTFGNYPPTEFLHPKELDFHCVNVYLHQQKPFENYLARLQMIADTKPLILGEFGIDSLREGEAAKCQILHWQIESASRGGLAGAIVYSFSDEWYKDGRQVMDWGFGLTTRTRQPKPSYAAVQKVFRGAPYFPLRQYPMVTVVVACYNGARTLKGCLDSLAHLNYPAYEVVLVNDGSTDETQQIAATFTNIRCLQHETNLGLSVARNTGIAAARGEIVAFTDADCRADENWLYYLVSDLLNSSNAGTGGHNLLPPDDSWVASAVMASPGGPAHVMLTDRVAEHIPGCNMAFYKWALEEVGGFDPVFRRAGDDVDFCWRVQQRGYRIGFSPAGFVWHYRRSTVRDYLKQQQGYGEAEALLIRKHPEYFGWFGGSTWQGRIYAPARDGLVFRSPRIYHGPFGSGFFQSLYSAHPELALMFFTSLEYQALVVLPLAVLALAYGFLLLPALIALLLPLAVCIAAALQANLPRKKLRLWSRPLVALLFYTQPLVRGWARYQGHLSLHSQPLRSHESLDSLSLKQQGGRFREVRYWVEQKVDRLGFLACVTQRLDQQGWQCRPDTGWNEYDLDISGNRWSRLQLVTVAEAHGEGRYLIRCRLRARWTFLARTTFFAALGAELLGIGFWGPRVDWHWLVLLSLGPLAWWLRLQGKNLQRLISVFLDEVAKELSLSKVS